MEDDLQTIWLNDDLCEMRDFRDENHAISLRNVLCVQFLNDDIITIIC